jgi:cell division protein FtsB
MRYWESENAKRSAQRHASEGRKHSIASSGSLRQYPFLRRFYQHQAVVGVRLQKFMFFVALATLLYAFVFGDAGVIHVVALKQQKAALQASVDAVDRDIASISGEIERLKSDPLAMEKLARERYGYIYPGDRVYKIVHPTK